MNKPAQILKGLAALFDPEDSPQEPFYDPGDLAAVLILTLVALGSLYWLLWTLLVYEGGLWIKAGAAIQVLFGSKSWADFGYRNAYERGLFEGWLGNALALVLCIAVLTALHRLYRQAQKKAAGK